MIPLSSFSSPLYVGFLLDAEDEAVDELAGHLAAVGDAVADDDDDRVIDTV